MTSKVVSREKILENIDDALKQVKQWKRMESWDFCAKYAAVAEAYIQLLEAQDCGSHGGFDPEDPNFGNHRCGGRGLESRYAWLKEKSRRPLK